MLKPSAFATSLAILTGAFYLLIHLIWLISPMLFRFVLNAQFVGADVASLMRPDFANFIISFLLAVLFAWLFGYAWAWLYNRLAQ
ncbi:MAG TPA: DUF5676 family membrane protein [Candidatus Binatia bacterium]|jgi:hypothetical protein